MDRVLANREDAVANGKPGMSKKLSVKASLMTPVLPMLVRPVFNLNVTICSVHFQLSYFSTHD